MKKRTYGFTMIELIVIIVIIGILAAVAIPRFINQTSNARIAALNGLAGAIRSTDSLAQAQYKAEADNTSTSIDMDGTAVEVEAGTGHPSSSAGGIGTALGTLSGFTANHGGSISTYEFSTPVSDCELEYDEDDGSVTLTTTGC